MEKRRKNRIILSHRYSDTRFRRKNWKFTIKFTFAKVEKAYYVEKYSDHVDGQNEKNRKARYYDRVKTIDGILENNKMCPEETLLQLENIDGTVLADVLAQISAEYSFQTIAGCSYNN